MLRQLFVTLLLTLSYTFSISAQKCGAYLAQSVWRDFMCYNLGVANSKADPLTPSWEINGGYWQWGKITMAASGPTGQGSVQARSEPVSGWATKSALSGAWMDNTKTPNDPCPMGFKVPSKMQWTEVIDNNPKTYIGSWNGSNTNYSSGIKVGDKMFLPAAGYRMAETGSLSGRGALGYYWNSTEASTQNAWNFYFVYGFSGPKGELGFLEENRTAGLSVRCIAELSPTNSSKCGALIAPGTWKEFMCHNLGSANTKADPFVPNWEINGGYWQWGRKNVAAAGPSGPSLAQANKAPISGWNSNPAPNGSWVDNRKTIDDPCPQGYRMPTNSQWEGIIKNNTKTYVGTWSENNTNYSSGLKIGNSLFLPTSGSRTSEEDYLDRHGNNGALYYRGEAGWYWSSTYSGSRFASALHFSYNDSYAGGNHDRSMGYSVRCIAE